MRKKTKTIIISLGGSLVVPEKIDWKFVKNFKRIIEKYIRENYRFIIITGGGKTARTYIEAAKKIDSINDEDKDWIGIHATRMNAHFIRTVFRKHAHSRINKNPHGLEDFYNFKEPILVAAGWRPGFSTDYDAVVIAKYFKADNIINLSNIDYVFDKDPKKQKEAKPIKKISWKDFRKMVGNKWSPGLNVPFDPVASKLAQENNLKVVIMNGNKLKNIQNYLEEKRFRGTIIS